MTRRWQLNGDHWSSRFTLPSLNRSIAQSRRGSTTGSPSSTSSQGSLAGTITGQSSSGCSTTSAYRTTALSLLRRFLVWLGMLQFGSVSSSCVRVMTVKFVSGGYRSIPTTQLLSCSWIRWHLLPNSSPGQPRSASRKSLSWGIARTHNLHRNNRLWRRSGC